MKYLRSTTLSCKDIGIRKLDIVAKTQLVSFPDILPRYLSQISFLFKCKIADVEKKEIKKMDIY